MATMKMSMKMPGCIFEYYGRIPEYVYTPDTFSSPLEEAVYKNDVNMFRSLVKEGHEVNVRLKINKMTCMEYAAMAGYTEILAALITESVCANILRDYFSLDDVVERAYLISKNKSVFFGKEALAEANRYVAALYTAIIYDQPRCVELMLSLLGSRDPARHSFYIDGANKTETLGASELARSLGHTECYKVVEKWQQMVVRT